MHVRRPLEEGRVRSGINGASNAGSVTGTQHILSEQACRQIQKFIILPIIREEKLKDFHSLVNGLPYRVARKEITCLRDLEKVLLWLAPVSRFGFRCARNDINDSFSYKEMVDFHEGLSQLL